MVVNAVIGTIDAFWFPNAESRGAQQGRKPSRFAPVRLHGPLVYLSAGRV